MRGLSAVAFRWEATEDKLPLSTPQVGGVPKPKPRMKNPRQDVREQPVKTSYPHRGVESTMLKPGDPRTAPRATRRRRGKERLLSYEML